MNVRPFALLSDAELAAARQRVIDQLEVWKRDWGLEQTASQVRCVRLAQADSAAPAPRWQCGFRHEGAGVWCAWHPDGAAHLQRQLFIPDEDFDAPARPAPLAAAAAQQALHGLAGMLAQSVFGSAASAADPVEPDPVVYTFGSGAVMVTILFDTHSVTCVLNHAALQLVAKVPAQRERAPISRAGLDQALKKIPVPLTVEVGQAAVNIASLMTLSVGDVIRLDQNVDKPLAVVGPERRRLFGAHLGLVDQTVAIEVVRSDQ
jgi:hypothetical protein